MSYTAGITITANVSGAINPLNQVSSAIKAAQASATQGVSGFTSLGNAARTAGSSVQSAGGGFTSFGGAVRTAQSSQQGFTSGLGQMSSAASSSGGSIRTMESAVSNSATTVNNANTAQKFFGTTLTNNGTSAAAAGTKFNALGQVISTNADATQKTSTSFGALNNVMGQTSTATEQTAQSTQRMGVNFGNAVGFMGAAVGSGVQLFETFESLERAQIGVEKSQNRVNTLTTSVARQQAALNEMVRNGQTGTTAYALAQQKLGDTEDKLQTAEEALKLKQNDLNVTFADFAKNIIPEVVSVGGTMIGALANLGVNTSGLKTKFLEMIPALTGGATGIRGFAAALATVALNPLVLGLTALAALLIAYKFNIGGTRDVTNQFGVAVGKLNPILQLVGDSLVSLGNRTIGFGMDQDKLDQQTDADWMNIGKNWNTMVLILQRGIGVAAEIVSNFFSPLTGALSRLSAALDPAAAAIESGLKQIGSAVLTFFTSTLPNAVSGAADWVNKNIVEPIKSAIAAIPNQITQGAIDLVAIIWGALKTASKAVTDALQWLKDNIVTPITSAILSIPSQLTSGFVDLVAIIWTGLKGASKVITDAVEWLRQNILAPIVSAVLAIPSNLTIGAIDVVAIIWKALQGASKAITDAAPWLKTNIIDPIVKAVQGAPTVLSTSMGKFDLGKLIWDVLIKGSTDLGGTIQKWLTDSILLPFTKVLDGIAKAFPAAAATINPIISNLWNSINNLTGAQDKNAGVVTKSAAAYNTYGAQTQFVSGTTTELGDAQNFANEGILQGAQNTEQLSKAQAKQSTEIEKNLSAVAGLSATLDAAVAISKNYNSVLDEEALKRDRQLAVLNAAGHAYRTLSDANRDASVALDAHTKLMETSAFKQQLQTKGINDQAKALADLQDKNITTAAALQKYQEQLDNGTMSTAKFTEGMLAQKKSMLDAEAETANMLGKLVELSGELRNGEAQNNAYNQSWIKTETEFVNGQLKISELDAQISVLNSHIEDGSSIVQAYATGLREGQVEFDKFLTSTIQGAAKTEVFNANLTKLSDAFGGLPSFMEPTIENTKTFVEAMLGSSEAAKKMHDELAKAFSGIESDASGFVSSIAGKFKDLNENIKKPFADLPDYIRNAMTPDDKAMTLAAARGEALGKQITGPFSLILAKEGPEAAANFLEGVQGGLKNVGDRQMLQPLIDNLRSGTAEGVLQATRELERLKDPMKGVANDMASTYLEGLANWPRDTQSAVDKAIQIYGNLDESAGQKAQDIAKIFHDLDISLPDDQIQKMADQLGIPFNTLKAAINQVPVTTKPAMDQTGQAIQSLGPTIGTVGNAFDQMFGVGIPSIIQASIPKITAAFQTIPTAIAPIFGEIGTLAQQSFDSLGTIATTSLQTVVAAFTQLQALIAPTFGAIGTLAQQSFDALGTIAATSLGSVVAAFQQLQALIAPTFGAIGTLAQQVFDSLAGIASTAISGVVSAFSQLQSGIAPIFGSLGTLAQQVFNGIVTSASSIIPKAAVAFTTLANQAKTGFTQLQTTATQVFNAIVSSATSIIPKAATAFTTMANQTKTAFSQIQSSATTAFNAVASAGQSAGSRVSSAMNQIANSAKQATQAVNQLRSAIDSLHDKTVTITTVYRTVGSPGFQHGGVITQGGREAFVTNRQQRYRGHIIGEAGKPELVLPLSKNVGDLADKSINLDAVLNRFKKGKGSKDKESDASKSTKIAFINPPPTAPRGQTSAERRDLTVKGKFQNDIPLQINIDGRKFMTMVQRQLLEFSDAAV